MDFDEGEFWDNSRVRYIDILDGPTPPASARNKLLNHFYDTEMNGLYLQIVMRSLIIIIFLTLISTFVISFVIVLKNLQRLRYSPHTMTKIRDGAFYEKFNGVDKDYKDVDWNTEFVFDRKLTHMKGTLFFLKNNKERLMMDEYFNVHPLGTKSILGGEDDEFIVSCVMANKGTYMLRNILLKEMTAGSTERYNIT